VCLNVNPGRADGAYGYVDTSGWLGGQAAVAGRDVAGTAEVTTSKMPRQRGLGSGPRRGAGTARERAVGILALIAS
jgi:hypothetical protein